MESLQLAPSVKKIGFDEPIRPEKHINAVEGASAADKVNHVENDLSAVDEIEKSVNSLDSSLIKRSDEAEKEEEKESAVSLLENDKARKAEVEESINVVNKVMDALNKELRFISDERLDDELVVQVIEKDSGKVVKQFPSDEILELRDKLEDTLVGVLVDDDG